MSWTSLWRTGTPSTGTTPCPGAPHTTTLRWDEDGATCNSCNLNILIKPSLMEVVQALNPGQPELPDWVYNGAILGVQGGTDKMLEHLAEAREHGIQVDQARWTSSRWPACGSRTGPARSSPTSARASSGTGGGTRRGTPASTPSSGAAGAATSCRDLDAEGVKVTAYITAHLNVLGDVYGEAAEVEGVVVTALRRTSGSRRRTGRSSSRTTGTSTWPRWT